MEIDELPFNRILRFRKANLEKFRAFSRELSSKGMLGVEGKRFTRRRMKLMMAVSPHCVDFEQVDAKHQYQVPAVSSRPCPSPDEQPSLNKSRG
jgi:hypothetical protein